MFDNLRNLSGMLGQAKQLREKFEQIQEELANRTVEGDAGAGAVRVTMNGRFEVVRVEIDRPMMTALAGEGDEADQQMVEELLAAGFNAALEKAQELVREEMSKLTGGLDIPGLDQLASGLGGQG